MHRPFWQVKVGDEVKGPCNLSCRNDVEVAGFLQQCRSLQVEPSHIITARCQVSERTKEPEVLYHSTQGPLPLPHLTFNLLCAKEKL